MSPAVSSTPTTLAAYALFAAAGAIVGLLLRRALRRGAYRRDAERGAPARDPSWLIPTLAVAWPLLAATAAGNRSDASEAVTLPLTVLPLYLAASIPLAWLAAVDLDVHRLPNAVTLPGLLIGPAALVALALGSGDPAGAGRAALGALAGATAYGLLYVVGRLGGHAGLGLGDVKLAGCLGPWLAYCGWWRLAIGVYLGLLIGGLAGTALLLARRVGRSQPVAHGPAMALGAWAALCLPWG